MAKFTQNPDSQQRDGFRSIGSVDGFIRQRPITNLKRPETYQSNKLKSDLRTSNNKGPTSELLSDDFQSFPGLKSTLEQPASHVSSGMTSARPSFSPPKTKRSFKPSLPSFKPLKFFKRFAMAATLLVFLAGGYLAIQGVLTFRNVFQDDGSTAIALGRKVDPGLLNSEGDGRVNMLILGKGGEGHPGGELTDSLVVASIDPFAKTAVLLSIPRDLYVDVPGLWGMKINAAYATAKQKSYDEGSDDSQAEIDGINTVKETVTQTIGVPINYHVVVDFTAFEEAVDAVGGIEITLDEPLYDSNFAPDVLDLDAGVQQLDGKYALYYSRSRVTSPRGDFDRGERQRQVLLALKDKALSAETFSNPIKISQLLSSLGDNVQTNISFDEIRQLYDLSGEIDNSQVESLELASDPVLVKTSFVGNQSVVIPIAGRNDFSEIKDYVRNQMRDGFINEEDSSVTVLNGSTLTGLGTSKANELRSYGYNVVEVGNSPTRGNLDTILIVNNELDVYTRRYLEQRLGVLGITNPPDTYEQYMSDFVIIVGANEGVSN